MNRLLPLILALSIPALAQQAPSTFTIPIGDGKTICEAASVLSICPAYQVAYSSDVVTVGGVPVTALNLTQLNLTGGTAYPDGTYNILLTNSAATLVPVATPPPTPTPGATYTVTLPNTSGTSWTVVPGLTLVKGQQVTVTAISTHTGPPVTSDWFYYSQAVVQADSAGAVYVGLRNATATAITKAQVMVVVK